jgi:hypothetical protein
MQFIEFYLILRGKNCVDGRVQNKWMDEKYGKMEEFI